MCSCAALVLHTTFRCELTRHYLCSAHAWFSLRMRISFSAAGLARPADSFITCLRARAFGSRSATRWVHYSHDKGNNCSA